MAENTILAFVGDLAVKSSGIVMLIAATRILSIEQVAILTIALAAVSVLLPMLDFGVSTLITRDGAATPSERGALLYGSAIARLPLVALCYSGALVFGLFKPAYLSIALLAVSAAVIGAILLGTGAALRSAENFGYEAIERFLSSILMLGLAVFLMRNWHSAEAVLVAALVSSALLIPIFIVPLRRATAWSRLSVKVMSVRALPYAYMAVATLLYYRAGTFILPRFRPAEEVASYTLAATSVIGMLMVPTAVMSGLLPRLSRRGCDGDHHEDTRRALRWSIGSTSIVAAGAAIICPFLLPFIYGDEYSSLLSAFFILLPTVVLTSAGGILATLMIAAGQRWFHRDPR